MRRFLRLFCCTSFRRKFLCVLFFWILISLVHLSLYIEDNFDTTEPFTPPVPLEVQVSLPLTPVINENPKYLVLIPAFGPNNQYRGLKEAMVAAKLLNRTLVRPSFIKHMTSGIAGYRPYDTTFQVEPLNRFLHTISLEEFLQCCNGTIDTLIWVRRKEQYWVQHLDNYLKLTKMKFTKEIECFYTNWNTHTGDPNAKVYFSKKDHFIQYLSLLNVSNDVRSIGFGFPFRNLEGELGELVSQTARVIERTPDIMDLAKRSWMQMGSSREKLLAVHWRHGEQTCRMENPLFHQGYDFCFGTSAYFWAHLDDLIKVLKAELLSKGLTHIYLATDSPDQELYKRMKKELPISRAFDIPLLSNITDNYFLSLVEQELCTQAKFFVASAQTTWSEFIINYWDSKRVYDKVEPPYIDSLYDLLFKNHHKIIQHDYWTWVLKTPEIPPEHCLFENTDFPGSDLSSKKSSNAIECFNDCRKNDLCTCWTFSLKTDMCFLKGGNCPHPTNASELISGPKDCPFQRTGPNDCWLDAADYSGKDIKGVEAKDTSTCQLHCQTEAQCKCWTWTTRDKMCWMKHTCDTLIHKKEVISGPKTC